MIHNIRISATSGREYQTSGAISVRAANPMKAAALALLDMGRPPSDSLKATFAEGAVSEMTLHRLARSYVPPRASWGAARDAERAASRA
jgi:hypothetical protein